MSADDDQAPDPRPGFYYVSVIDGPRRALVRGPWPTHAEALLNVARVRRDADRADPRAWFYAWGTARCEVDRGPGSMGPAYPAPTRAGRYLRRTVRPNFGGKHCVFTTYQEVTHPLHGLCRLESTRENTATTYYIRMGIREDGLAAGGGMPYKRKRDAIPTWTKITTEARAAGAEVAS